jgi:hypothetical protein
MKDNHALIILGMHRSGTSLLTGLLSQVGVQMGKSLYAPQKGVNEKGFWEHEDIVDTHDELLLNLDSQWDDLLPLADNWWQSPRIKPFAEKLSRLVRRDFASARVWALKDPRMCRLLPLWLSILAASQVKVTFICMNRNPFEVSASLQKRDGFSREKAFVLWLNHSLSAELYSRGLPRIFIEFDDVVRSPVQTLLKIEQGSAAVFPTPVNEAIEKIGSFVSPGLRHHVANTKQDDIREPLSLMAQELHRIFGELAAGKPVPQAVMDKVHANFRAYREKWSPELIEQIHYLNRERADYRIKFFQIYRSMSWMAVKPLWLIEKLLRKY